MGIGVEIGYVGIRGDMGFCWALAWDLQISAWDLWVFTSYDMGLNFFMVKFMGLVVLDGVTVGLFNIL